MTNRPGGSAASTAAQPALVVGPVLREGTPASGETRIAVGLEVETEVDADLVDGAGDERVVVEVVDRQAVATERDAQHLAVAAAASGPTSASRTTPRSRVRCTGFGTR